MTGSPSINPPFPIVGTYQVNFREYGNDVKNHRNHAHYVVNSFNYNVLTVSYLLLVTAMFDYRYDTDHVFI